VPIVALADDVPVSLSRRLALHVVERTRFDYVAGGLDARIRPQAPPFPGLLAMPFEPSAEVAVSDTKVRKGPNLAR
jgi:hypothetical protein